MGYYACGHQCSGVLPAKGTVTLAASGITVTSTLGATDWLRRCDSAHLGGVRHFPSQRVVPDIDIIFIWSNFRFNPGKFDGSFGSMWARTRRKDRDWSWRSPHHRSRWILLYPATASKTDNVSHSAIVDLPGSQKRRNLLPQVHTRNWRLHPRSDMNQIDGGPFCIHTFPRK